MVKRIIYVARACPKDIYDMLELKTSIAANKFNKLLIEGFSCNNVEVHVIGVFDKCFNSLRIVKEDNITYYCAPQMHFLKKIIFSAKIYKKILKQKNSFFIADYLNVLLSLVGCLISKYYHRESVAIVTDLPEFLVKGKRLKNKLYISFSYFVLKLFEKHVLLTEYMSKKINKNKYIVIEGVVDIININEKKVTNNEIVYAGMLNVEYGIKLLIDAFILLNNGEYTLELYGTGNYVKDIESICLQYKNINYHGIVSNDMIIKKEEDAFLLVNPRCSKDEFTKYSFPSKNMEYMLSGTPMLCSKLPGLPHEYKNYVYIFEDETVEGLAKTLKEIISLNKNIHLKKGKDAQKFVLENKNKIIQAKKIIAFLEDR